jgi:hypothetical protein
MDGKKRIASDTPARRTGGEGVPKTRRQGPETSEDRAEPQRGKEPASGRLIDRSRTARNPDGI